MRDRPSAEFMRQQRKVELKKRRHWVYGLVLETRLIFYIGCSCNPWVRLQKHRWRLGFRDSQLIIFGSFPSRELALDAERQMIKLFPNPFNGRRSEA